MIETDVTSGGWDTVDADAENGDSCDELLVAETENKALYYASPIQSFGLVCDGFPQFDRVGCSWTADYVDKHGENGENEGNSRRGDKCNDYLASSEMESKRKVTPRPAISGSA